MEKIMERKGKIIIEPDRSEFHSAEPGLHTIDTEAWLTDDNIVCIRAGCSPDTEINDFVGTIPNHNGLWWQSVVMGQGPGQVR
jgi:hypothetical protein